MIGYWSTSEAPMGSSKEENVEVYWEGELVSSLEELKKYRKKNKLLKEQLINIEELNKEENALTKQINQKKEELEKQLKYT